MKHVKHIAGMMILVMALAACQGSGAPWMRKMMDGPPKQANQNPLPPLYLTGWKDGCETGVSANTNSFYKFYYKYRQNADLVMNDIYYRGWKDAFDYCQRYTRMYYSRQFP